MVADSDTEISSSSSVLHSPSYFCAHAFYMQTNKHSKMSYHSNDVRRLSPTYSVLSQKVLIIIVVDAYLMISLS